MGLLMALVGFRLASRSGLWLAWFTGLALTFDATLVFDRFSGMELPRFAGVPTFMRLPYVPFDHPRFSEVQVGLIGTPWDGGTTNRPGPRHGPRQLRDASTMIRAEHAVSGRSAHHTRHG